MGEVRQHGIQKCNDSNASLTITLEDNIDTLLTCPVVDQAALHGLIKKVRNLGMPLISVNRVKPNQGDVPDVKHLIEASC
jgi:hypothetical protein